MKTIGLIGGMSWESSQEYYRLINEMTHERLGDLHSAQCLMFSFDFAEIEELQRSSKWEEATSRLVTAAQNLEKGGADLLLICTNTMHKMAKEVQDAVHIPLLHIADPTGEAIRAQKITKIGLLGTKYTMEQEFYKARLVNEFGLEVIIPSEDDRQVVHDIIYDELCKGIVTEDSKQKYKDVIQKLKEQGAEGIILGCTEITLLIGQMDSSLPVFDTTRIHAEAAVRAALI